MNRTARLLAIILTLVLVGGGIYLAYQSGYDAGTVAAATTENDGARTVVVDRGWGWGGFGFFPFFPLFFPFLFFFLLFGLFRPWRYGGPGRWSHGPGWGPPEHLEKRMEEWHRQVHEAQTHPEK